MKTNNYFAAWI